MKDYFPGRAICPQCGCRDQLLWPVKVRFKARHWCMHCITTHRWWRSVRG